MLRKLVPLAIALWSLAPMAQSRLLYESNTLALYSIEAEAGAKNQHPVDANPEQLEALLSHLEVISSNTGGKPTPLFPDDKALAAAQELHTALRYLEPNQELLFVGFRNEGNLLRSKRYETAARAFVQDGHLNLILGEVDQFHAEFRAQDKPLPSIGSRTSETALTGSIAPASGISPVKDRKDWLALDLRLALAPKKDRRVGYDRVGYEAQPAPTAPPAPAQAPLTQQESPVAKDKTSQSYQPTPGLNPEVQKIEQEFELLQRLRAKGLITEKDYEQKKKQLLDRL